MYGNYKYKIELNQSGFNQVLNLHLQRNMELYRTKMLAKYRILRWSIQPCELDNPFMSRRENNLMRTRHNSTLKKTVENYRRNVNKINAMCYPLWSLVQQKNMVDMFDEIYPYLLDEDFEFGPAPTWWTGVKYYRHNFPTQWKAMWDTISGRLVYLGYPKYDFKMNLFDLELYMFTSWVALCPRLINLVHSLYLLVDKRWSHIAKMLNDGPLKGTETSYLATEIGTILDSFQDEGDFSIVKKVNYYLKGILSEEEFKLAYTWYMTMNHASE
jgi:hypothetical protein